MQMLDFEHPFPSYFQCQFSRKQEDRFQYFNVLYQLFELQQRQSFNKMLISCLLYQKELDPFCNFQRLHTLVILLFHAIITFLPVYYSVISPFTQPMNYIQMINISIYLRKSFHLAHLYNFAISTKKQKQQPKLTAKQVAKSIKQNQNRPHISIPKISKLNGNKTLQSSKAHTISPNWSRYSKDVFEVFSKKQINDIDLAFIADKIKNKELQLNRQLTQKLKNCIKQLKSIDFSLIPTLLELSFMIGILAPPQLFHKQYLDYYKSNTFTVQENQALNFPTYFYKKVGLDTVILCGEKKEEQFIAALKHFGSLLSINQLKKIDEFCTKRVNKMSTDDIVRLLNIFRQIKKAGTFVECAEEAITVKAQTLSSKFLIMSIISFLQLGKHQTFAVLQSQVLSRISHKKFHDSEVISILHIMHKYKTGSRSIWPSLAQYFAQVYKKIPFQHLFAIMSGLSRNRMSSGDLFIQLTDHEPKYSYVKILNQKQFVQFFIVLYANYKKLPIDNQSKYCKNIKQAIKSKQLRSVYTEIQHFFLYLFEDDAQIKRNHLRKAYPDDLLISLLSIVFEIQNVDIRQKKQYENDLEIRYTRQELQDHKQVIVIEQFIRYKMMSVMKP